MFHMITDNIEAYRRAVQATAKASFANDKAYNSHGLYQELTDCREEERIRYDGLVSVIIMEIKAAAADEPHNPFSINEDVNQPDKPPIRTTPPPRTEE
jgi:hypothetical protein